jgi:hypothetical protein
VPLCAEEPGLDPPVYRAAPEALEHVPVCAHDGGDGEARGTIEDQAEICYTTCVMPKGIIDVA